jgi:hypothetical protein
VLCFFDQHDGDPYAFDEDETGPCCMTIYTLYADPDAEPDGDFLYPYYPAMATGSCCKAVEEQYNGDATEDCDIIENEPQAGQYGCGEDCVGGSGGGGGSGS